jgi:hypothetical protein
MPIWRVLVFGPRLYASARRVGTPRWASVLIAVGIR